MDDRERISETRPRLQAKGNDSVNAGQNTWNGWDDHRSALYQDADRFARDALRADTAERDVSGEFDRAGWKQCAEFGLLKMPVPQKHGGDGKPLSDLLTVMEGLGHGTDDQGLLFALNAHLWTVVLPLSTHGTPAQRARYLPALMQGSSVGANASTEDEAGSDVYAMRARAEKDGDSYVLNGTKSYITNAPIADLFVVYATVDPALGALGVTAFLVDARTPGLHKSAPVEKMGMRTALMGRITLTDCRVPAEAVLGKPGRGVSVFDGAMEYERGCILATTLGAMQRQLEQSINHARTRKQFGRAIGKNQAVSHRIADMKVTLDAARELIHRVGKLKDEGKSIALASASAKLFVSEAYVKFSLDALRIQGGRGYLTGAESERQLRNSAASVLYSGTSDIQRNLIASQLGL
ncbi:acyl-CoA dehydrogenase family protein [Streptomyces microflavus]|uniref:acyl-CoA dehydrogenase family protein n=1 Tax=Streptomyces microflavus TaxID=1919 RepID=UPI00381D9E81